MPLLTFPWPQILSADGSTYPGAKLFFYETGTSTLATTYSDAGLTTPHTNPVVADATGVFPPIYLANKRYKLVLKTAGDVTLFTADPVNDAAAYNVSTIAAMTAITAPTNGTSVVVTDIHRGGTFIFDTSATSAGDGGTTFSPDDATTGSWVRQYSGPIDVKWFGAVGDGVANDTSEIQDAIDAAVAAGESLHFPAGTYLVSKNPALTGFPGNDQPCLLIRDATRLHISGHGAKLKVNVHAQGILEIQESTGVVIEGLTFIGPGDYPQLDGTTGKGEKGNATNGYDTESYWGYYKNNSSDTSASTAGGYSGSFPQYGGGTASTWGTWNGGYIGNVGAGVLIHNDCHDITLRSCEASGFNYAGFKVGFRGDYFPVDREYPDSTNINFSDCYVHDCYSHGFQLSSCDGAALDALCIAEDIGHPSAVPATDTEANPGYGVGCEGNEWSFAKNVSIGAMRIENCVRKGIDSHSSAGLTIVGARVKNCAAAGIYATWTNDDQPVTRTVITGCQIENCNYSANNNLGALYVNGVMGSTGTYSYANALIDAVVSSNILTNCGGLVQIRAQVARNLSICNNIVRGVDSRYASDSYGIYIGRTDETSYHVNCSGNIVDANGNSNLVRGITMLATDLSQCNNNIVTLDHASATQGIRANACLRTDFFGNRVYIDAGATTSAPLNLQATDGLCAYNYADPDVGTLSYPIASETTAGAKEEAFRVPHLIQLDITFNGTTSPSYTVNAGSDYVDSVAELATYGVRVVLKNIQPSAILRSSIVNQSADGLESASGDITFIYERAIGYQSLDIGLKTNASGTNIIASACTAGTISILIFAF